MNSNKGIYRKHLENAPKVIREAVHELQTIIINLAMSGELADVNDQFEENDELKFDYEDFRNLADYNVQLLYSLYDFMEQKQAELINVNVLKDEEDEDYPF